MSERPVVPPAPIDSPINRINTGADAGAPNTPPTLEDWPSIHDSEHPRSDESIAADEPPLDEGAPPTMIQPG